MADCIDNGGPAFPFEYELSEGLGRTTHTGMSLRDWFAGQALAGIATVFCGAGGKSDFPEAARRSYEIADAMLAARTSTRKDERA